MTYEVSVIAGLNNSRLLIQFIPGCEMFISKHISSDPFHFDKLHLKLQISVHAEVELEIPYRMEE